jgi:hypothetical protein
MPRNTTVNVLLLNSWVMIVVFLNIVWVVECYFFRRTKLAVSTSVSPLQIPIGHSCYSGIRTPDFAARDLVTALLACDVFPFVHFTTKLSAF